jgi:hypothetical protein
MVYYCATGRIHIFYDQSILFGFTAHQHYLARSDGADTGKVILANPGCYKLRGNTRGQNHFNCWSLDAQTLDSDSNQFSRVRLYDHAGINGGCNSDVSTLKLEATPQPQGLANQT